MLRAPINFGKIANKTPGSKININDIEKYEWKDGDKRYTLQAYDMKEHWEEFLPFFAKGFAHSTVAERYLPDVSKREKFFNLYFQHRYKTSFSDGRASLSGIKVHEVIDGKEQATLIYGGIGLYDTTGRDADATDLMNFDKEMAEIMFRRDQWLEENIHGPMRRVAEKMGTVAWFGANHTTDPTMRSQEIVLKYVRKIYKINIQYGLLRHKQLNLPKMETEPDFYTYLIEAPPRSDMLLKVSNYQTVAHLHYNHSKECGCYQDQGIVRKNISCHFIVVTTDMAQSVRMCLSELKNDENEKAAAESK